MHPSNSTNPSGTPFKHGVPEGEPADPAEANDFGDIAAQRRHVLALGRAVIFNDLHRSRVMFVGRVDIPEEGKPVYMFYADPEALRNGGVTDYYLNGAVLMATDVYRTPPAEKTYGFHLAPPRLDKTEDAAAAEFKQVETIYDLYADKHEARAKREAVYKCCRCKRQDYMPEPDDFDPICFCSVPAHLEVHPENPEECVYYWFDRWYGSPPHVK